MEVLALRHQLNVLERSVKRPKLSASDRFFWACLAATWRSWRSALIIVKPETVIGWRQDGFRLFWRWKSRQGRRGRPRVTVETRQLIRQMSQRSVTVSASEVVPGVLSRHANHLSLEKDTPESRSVQPPESGRVVAVPQVGGLHHRYERGAA
jgi:hypothetical protein